MKEYIKKFETAEAGDNYSIANIPFMTSVETSGQNLVCNQSGKKLVNEFGILKIQSDGPEMIDLGLSVKWAKANIGATCGDTAESWYGGFYAWGETETKEDYRWETYKFGTASPFSKYDTDGKTILESVDDVATTIYGSNYRMPTKAECEELKALPNRWVTDYNGIFGLNGRVFTGTNGNILFIPAAGSFNGSTRSNIGSGCYLWSSSLYSGNPSYAWNLNFYSSYVGLDSDGYRYVGFSVRCVSKY